MGHAHSTWEGRAPDGTGGRLSPTTKIRPAPRPPSVVTGCPGTFSRPTGEPVGDRNMARYLLDIQSPRQVLPSGKPHPGGGKRRADIPPRKLPPEFTPPRSQER